jgi:hypothetical protein
MTGEEGGGRWRTGGNGEDEQNRWGGPEFNIDRRSKCRDLGRSDALIHYL